MNLLLITEKFSEGIAERLRKVLKSDRISNNQWHIIDCLASNRHVDVTAGYVAETLGKFEPSLSRSFKLLLLDGRINESISPRDRRFKYFTLTPRGAGMHRRLKAKADAAMQIPREDIESHYQNLKMHAE